MSQRDVYQTGFDEQVGRTIDDNASCPECDGSIVVESGERRCSDCSLVIEDSRIDHGPEWRTFQNEETTRSRTGAPLTQARHDRGLSTKIGRKQDGNGNTLSGKKRSQLGRLRRENTRGRFKSKKERNLAEACTEINRLTSALDLPSAALERASKIFRKAHEADLLMGRSIETIASGSVYAAVRCGTWTRTIEEIAEVSRVSKAKVELGYQVMNVELELEAKPQSPQEFVPQLSSKLELSNQVERRAVTLAKEVFETGLASGRKPSGVAAGCLYHAARECGEDLTQSEVASVANTTPVTVRSSWNLLTNSGIAESM
ncbi:Transcription initiation factor TFIIB, Brf1 subunit/Transcription initiation factor TFIIB (plasmid) [Halalkaliarchaeum sp. AArc-CO]|uniref:transcription initiation factor IIB n=1 Tax=Halalkaliarchaeum sp. AArc-CO TaxID=2866381 RepID=UPI00217DD966|nr:TFIIB-type zinc ribbon-containing protein [Halalkaliarchaeum sp. AArc-CO]UWG49275.1 Transcription initiation factor TFIIB, Brf1 subunit/Transcription initiation factor TFIIB [Halalkaliarchaeum sp. AArc-CO]